MELSGESDHVLGLVGLQVPDHGPAQVRMGGQSFGLRHRLLYPVLPEEPHAGRVRLLDDLGRLSLADRQQPHLGGVSAGPFAGRSDLRLYRSEVVVDPPHAVETSGPAPPRTRPATSTVGR